MMARQVPFFHATEMMTGCVDVVVDLDGAGAGAVDVITIVVESG